MDPLDIALIFLGVGVVFLGLLVFSMHLINRNKKDLQDSDPKTKFESCYDEFLERVVIRA